MAESRTDVKSKPANPNPIPPVEYVQNVVMPDGFAHEPRTTNGGVPNGSKKK